MAIMLNDFEIGKLIGTVIVDGDILSIRPNSYILRLGATGEFLNTGKDFDIGLKKKGVRIQPGHSIGVTAYETLDFRRETVHKIYPGHDLHAIVSPTTDLSREGIVAPTTQVDAGYNGTLNWTITNTSSEERRYLYKERIYRLTIFKLEKGETPEHIYQGSYQSQTGYVRSKRSGPPVGMKDSDWEDGQTKGGPEDLLDNLMRSGYPWHILGSRLKQIDQQFKSVTEEYAAIHDSIEELRSSVHTLGERQSNTPETIRKILKEETNSMQNRWLIGSGCLLFAVLGICVTCLANPSAFLFVKEHSSLIGLGLIGTSAFIFVMMSRK